MDTLTDILKKQVIETSVLVHALTLRDIGTREDIDKIKKRHGYTIRRVVKGQTEIRRLLETILNVLCSIQNNPSEKPDRESIGHIHEAMHLLSETNPTYSSIPELFVAPPSTPTELGKTEETTKATTAALVAESVKPPNEENEKSYNSDEFPVLGTVKSKTGPPNYNRTMFKHSKQRQSIRSDIWTEKKNKAKPRNKTTTKNITRKETHHKPINNVESVEYFEFYVESDDYLESDEEKW